MTQAATAPPLGRPGLLLMALGLLVSIACVSVLHARTFLPTSFFGNDSGLSDGAFDAQLVVMTLGVVALQLAPLRHARLVAIAEGALCIAAYRSSALFFAAWLFVWFAALEVRLPARARLAVPFLLLLGCIVLAVLHVVASAYLFSLLFTPRLMMYAWDKWQRGWPRGSLPDFLLYFMSAPLLVFPPYVVIVPYYDRHAAKFAARLTTERARAAFGFIGAGLLAHVVYLVARVEVGGYSGWFAQYYLGYLFVILKVSSVANIAHGLLLLHGFVDRPPVDAPLLATDFVEVWNRFQRHQKDMQVSLFYAPVVIRLRRKNRYVAIAVATAVTMLVGNFAIHLLARYLFSPEIYSRDVFLTTVAHLYPNLLVFTVVLAATLCIQEWRKRARRPAPRGAAGILYTLTCWAATVTLSAVLWAR